MRRVALRVYWTGHFFPRFLNGTITSHFCRLFIFRTRQNQMAGTRDRHYTHNYMKEPSLIHIVAEKRRKVMFATIGKMMIEKNIN